MSPTQWRYVMSYAQDLEKKKDHREIGVINAIKQEIRGGRLTGKYISLTHLQADTPLHENRQVVDEGVVANRRQCLFVSKQRDVIEQNIGRFYGRRYLQEMFVHGRLEHILDNDRRAQRAQVVFFDGMSHPYKDYEAALSCLYSLSLNAFLGKKLFFWNALMHTNRHRGKEYENYISEQEVIEALKRDIQDLWIEGEVRQTHYYYSGKTNQNKFATFLVVIN